MNIRGELQLCVSLRELLGLKGGPTQQGRLLVTEHENQRWVFAADEVAGVQRLEMDALGNAPSTVAHSPQRFSAGVFLWEGKRVGYLAAERVFEALKGQIG